MRNPIQPSPDRPIPLPDCILLDAWWADARREQAESRPFLHLVAPSQDAARDDRAPAVRR